MQGVVWHHHEKQITIDDKSVRGGCHQQNNSRVGGASFLGLQDLPIYEKNMVSSPKHTANWEISLFAATRTTWARGRFQAQPLVTASLDASLKHFNVATSPYPHPPQPRSANRVGKLDILAEGTIPLCLFPSCLSEITHRSFRQGHVF